MRRLLLTVMLLGACSKPSGTPVDFSRRPAAGVTAGTWVAKFGGDTVTDQELLRRFAELSPYARARFQAPEQRREYVDGLVRWELIAQEAVRRGLANDPDVVEVTKRVMVQKLLGQIEQDTPPATDEQVRAYYAAHTSDYVKPAMTRLAHIAFKKEHRKEAEETLKAALALAPLDYAGFGTLARERSEETRTKPLDGDLRFLSDEELSKQFGAALVTAAALLTQVGQVHPTLVETDDFLHVVKLQGRQLAVNMSADQAKPSIQALLANDARQAQLKRFYDELSAKAKVQVNDAVLNAMQVDVKAPQLQGKNVQPGYQPPPQVPQTK